MLEGVELYIREVPATAGKVNVRVVSDAVSIRVELGAVQDPRFFEKFLVDRPASKVPHVMSRICGVCSVVHLTCSAEAVEKALGARPSWETLALRDVAKGLEVVQNNFVHVLMCAQDYTGLDNVLEFSKAYPELFKEIMEVNAIILGVYRRVGGRFIHSPGVGPLAQWKPIHRRELEAVSAALKEVSRRTYELTYELADVWRPVAEGFRDPAPAYCVLHATDSYPYFSSALYFSDGDVVRAERYMEAMEERATPYSNSHYTLYKGRAFYVGSRARLQAYSQMLTQESRDLVRALRIDFENPFDNVKAQLVEVHFLAQLLSERAASLAEGVRRSIETQLPTRVPQVDGEGVGLATAPRGVLIHHYAFRAGKLTRANVITPTVMNARHMEVSGEALVRWLLSRGVEGQATIKRMVEALIRSYDPCFPCAVH